MINLATAALLSLCLVGCLTAEDVTKLMARVQRFKRGRK